MLPFVNLVQIVTAAFDHKTVVAGDDPDLEMFKEMEKRGMIELVVMKDGVGIERFAEFCCNTANEYINDLTQGRCWCEKVEIWEHEGNSAIYEVPIFKNDWKS